MFRVSSVHVNIPDVATRFIVVRACAVTTETLEPLPDTDCYYRLQLEGDRQVPLGLQVVKGCVFSAVAQESAKRRRDGTPFLELVINAAQPAHLVYRNALAIHVPRKLASVLSHFPQYTDLQVYTELSTREPLPGIGAKTLAALSKVYSELADPSTGEFAALFRSFPGLIDWYRDDVYTAGTMLRNCLEWMQSTRRTVDDVVDDPYRYVIDRCYDTFTPEPVFAESSRQQRRVLADRLWAAAPGSGTRGKRRVYWIERASRAISSDTKGYWVEPDQLFDTREEHCEFDGLVAAGLVPGVYNDARTLVSLAIYDDIEQRLASLLVSLCVPTGESTASLPPPPSLDSDQRLAHSMAVSQGVSVLSGYAGTGKTTTVAAICDSLPGLTVCAAPTGKAAMRLSEVSSQPAYTIHHLLQRGSTVSPDTLIFDEQSMQDPVLVYRCLQCYRASVRRVLFVGDPAQLPSIAHGCFLRDLLRSRLPRTSLERVHRSDVSLIAENAALVRTGSMDSVVERLGVFEIRPSSGVYHVAQQILAPAFRERYTESPPTVLCATNAHALLLNAAMRDVYNPGVPRTGGIRISTGPASAEWAFGVGDLVMNTRNMYKASTLVVSNGSTGRVTNIRRQTTGGWCVQVRYPGGEHLLYLEHEPDTSLPAVRDLCPAWCMTVHKSQGSEFRDVVYVCCYDSVKHGLVDRSFVYTAITRAKASVVVYNQRMALSHAVAAEGGDRITRLTERMDQRLASFCADRTGV